VNRVLYGIAQAHNLLHHLNKNIEINNKKSINNLLTWKYSEKESENILTNTNSIDKN
jgi:hypothetical protein